MPYIVNLKYVWRFDLVGLVYALTLSYYRIGAHVHYAISSLMRLQMQISFSQKRWLRWKSINFIEKFFAY